MDVLPDTVATLRAGLLAWYRKARRDLPWRASRDPYHVLVSELMLQQTRVDVVLPYFVRWVERWPTAADLADADEDDVVAMWSGLGYYRRARHLLAAARAIVAAHGGVVPRDPDLLRSLPGVGPYTAAAVASIAYDERIAVVDGNVERVLCRLLDDARPPGAARRRGVEAAADELVQGASPSDWNQAMMELGALVCTPKSPQCLLCPWRETCRGRAAGRAAELPVGAPKKTARDVVLRMAVVRRGERILLVRRPEGKLLSGMWELPTTGEGGDVAELVRIVRVATGADVELPHEARGAFRHSITNRRITAHVHACHVAPGAAAVAEAPHGVVWVSPAGLADYGVSSMTRKALALARKSLGSQGERGS